MYCEVLSPFARRSSARPAARAFVPENDAAFFKIAGGQFDLHTVAHDRADAEFAHLPGRVGDDPMAVLEHDAKAAIARI